MLNRESLMFQEFIQNVKQLDLGPIAYQLMRSRSGLRWTPARTQRAIVRYLAFLYLINRYPRLQLTPTWEIDQVWHCHILDTDKYAKDCDTLFGQFIHHFPYFGVRGENDRQAWYRAYALTQVLFRKHFGFELAADLKAVPADCEPLQIVHSTIDGSTEQSRPRVEFSLEEALRVWE